MSERSDHRGEEELARIRQLLEHAQRVKAARRMARLVEQHKAEELKKSRPQPHRM